MTNDRAIYLLGWLRCKTGREDDLEAIDMAIDALKARPTGEWEHLSIKSISRSGVDELQELQCSNCGRWVTTPYMYYPSYHKFCPCCGAMMANSNEGADMRGEYDE